MEPTLEVLYEHLICREIARGAREHCGSCLPCRATASYEATLELMREASVEVK